MSDKKQQYQRNQQKVSNIEQINVMYGKLPPQAIEVEEAVLGALMLEEHAIYKVSSIISEESFYKSEHQLIYKTVLQLSDAGKKIDLSQLQCNLKTQGNSNMLAVPL